MKEREGFCYGCHSCVKPCDKMKMIDEWIANNNDLLDKLYELEKEDA